MADLFNEDDFLPNPASGNELDLLLDEANADVVEASLISTTQTVVAEPTVEPTTTLSSSSTPETLSQPEVTLPTSPSRFSFFSRVSKTFPVVNALSGRAAELYNNVKNLNPTIKSGLDSAESTLDGKLRAYENILAKVDAFGNRQLDKVEELAQVHPLESFKCSSSCLTQAIAEKVVAPASTAISQNLDKAISLTERAVNSYVPEPEKTTCSEGKAPVARVKALATRVTTHVKNTVAVKLPTTTNIRVRSAQQVEQFKANSVDLIKYFNEQIAVQPTKLVAKLQEESGKKLEKGLEVYSAVTDAIKSKTGQIKKRISVARHQAQTTVSRLISENLPAISVSEKLQPYLLYVDTHLPSYLSSLARRYASASTSPSIPSKGTTAVQEKLVNAEAEATQTHTISPLGIPITLPSVSQLKFLLSQRTLKTTVERMLELIAKPRVFFPAQQQQQQQQQQE